MSGGDGRPEAAATLACWALSREGLGTGGLLCGRLAERPWAAPGGAAVGRCHLLAPARICARAAPHATPGPEPRPFARFAPALAAAFRRHRAHIVIGAAGIAVRALAPLLLHKSQDPPVVVLDAAGRHAVSLLSGHWGGANDLARHVARLLGGEAVITTASDGGAHAGAHGPALDLLAREAGLALLDWERLPRVAAALLEGEPVPLSDPRGCLPGARAPQFRRGASGASGDIPLVAVHWRKIEPGPLVLRLAAPRLFAGVGCRRGVDAASVQQAVRAVLDLHGLEPAALAALATVEEKAAEPAMAEAAAGLGVPLLAFAAPRLAAVPVPTPSAAAGARFGLAPFSVCEGAALVAAETARPGCTGRLLAPKTVFAGRITVAVAVSAAPGEGENA